MLAAIQSDLKAGVLEVIEVDWADVHLIAERLSGKHADARGIRAMDTLHLASAIHLGARILLSSDVRQRRIAELEGMQSAP